MTEVLFYHLERASLESVLPGLLEKTLEREQRAVVRAASTERVEALDARLWTYRDESFLPHAAAGDGARQPVWLTAGDDAPNAIYQITRAFRDEEVGPLHNTEFTIVEWYRVGDTMDEGTQLLSELAEALLERGPADRDFVLDGSEHRRLEIGVGQSLHLLLSAVKIARPRVGYRYTQAYCVE